MTTEKPVSEGACCACLTVKWQNMDLPGGWMRGRWECTACHRTFMPTAQHEHLYHSRDAEVAAFKTDREWWIATARKLELARDAAEARVKVLEEAVRIGLVLSGHLHPDHPPKAFVAAHEATMRAALAASQPRPSPAAPLQVCENCRDGGVEQGQLCGMCVGFEEWRPIETARETEYLVTCPRCGRHTVADWLSIPPGGVSPCLCRCGYAILSESEGEPEQLRAGAGEAAAEPLHGGGAFGSAGVSAEVEPPVEVVAKPATPPVEPTAEQVEEMTDLLSDADTGRESYGASYQSMARAVLRRYGLPPKPPTGTPRPTVVCLCGSTRFMDAFFEVGWSETLAGKIVLSVGVCKHATDHGAEALGQDVADRLDELHLRKIDLADEVYILNVGGYIGESTARELAYAQSKGKRIRFLEPKPPTGARP
jgi:hypothetical protein